MCVGLRCDKDNYWTCDSVGAGPIESLPLVLSVSEVVVGIVFHPSVKQLLWKTSPRILAKLGTNVQ